MNTAIAINENGTWRDERGALHGVSIGSWVYCRDGHKGYVRAIDYANQVAWVSDGDGACEYGFNNILAQ